MGVGETCFEFGLTPSWHGPQLCCGSAAALPAAARLDRGRVRAAPWQAPRKVLLVPPGLSALCPRPTEPFQPRLPPDLSALPTPSSKETIIIALLAWWGRIWQSLASGAQRHNSRSEGGWARGPGVQRTFGSLALALASSSARSVSLLVLFPSVSLSACSFCLPWTACLCTVRGVKFRRYI